MTKLDRHKKILELISEKTVSTQTELTELLIKAGFVRYEVSNYAKPGFECKHNKKYCTLYNKQKKDGNNKKVPVKTDVKKTIKNPSTKTTDKKSNNTPKTEKTSTKTSKNKKA